MNLKYLAVFLLLLLSGCKLQEQKSEAAVCGNDICETGESETCRADCGGLEGITKRQCEEAGGRWNECGSPCAGLDVKYCIQVCSAQCECNAKELKCPEGTKCRLSGKIPNEIGVCTIYENLSAKNI